MMETSDNVHEEEGDISKAKKGNKKVTSKKRMQKFDNSGNVGSEMGPVLSEKFKLNEKRPCDPGVIERGHMPLLGLISIQMLKQ